MRVMIQSWQLWCSLVRETNKGTVNLDILITFGLSGVYNLLQSFLECSVQHISLCWAPSPFLRALPNGTKLQIHRRARDHCCINNIVIIDFPKILRGSHIPASIY